MLTEQSENFLTKMVHSLWLPKHEKNCVRFAKNIWIEVTVYLTTVTILETLWDFVTLDATYHDGNSI